MAVMKKIRLLLLLFFVFIHYIIIAQGYLTYEGVGYIPDSTKQFGKILSKGTIVVDRQTANVWIITATTTVTTKTLQTTTTKESVGGAGIAFLDIDLDRAIKRTYSVGTTIPGDNLEDFIDYIYYAPPTISIAISPTTTVYEVGTTNSITISGATINNGDVLSAGAIKNSGGSTTYYSFGSAATYSKNISFTPRETVSDTFTDISYTFRAFQTYVGTESGTASSSIITVYGIYPYFSLIHATDYSGASPTVIYNAFKTNKSVVVETSSKAVSFTGDGYVYFLQDASYDTLTQILNPSLLDEFLSFTRYEVTITSTDLAGDYTAIPYNLYKSDSYKYGLVGYTYTFKQ